MATGDIGTAVRTQGSSGFYLLGIEDLLAAANQKSIAAAVIRNSSLEPLALQAQASAAASEKAGVDSALRQEAALSVSIAAKSVEMQGMEAMQTAAASVVSNLTSDHDTKAATTSARQLAANDVSHQLQAAIGQVAGQLSETTVSSRNYEAATTSRPRSYSRFARDLIECGAHFAKALSALAKAQPNTLSVDTVSAKICHAELSLAQKTVGPSSASFVPSIDTSAAEGQQLSADINLLVENVEAAVSTANAFVISTSELDSAVQISNTSKTRLDGAQEAFQAATAGRASVSNTAEDIERARLKTQASVIESSRISFATDTVNAAQSRGAASSATQLVSALLRLETDIAVLLREVDLISNDVSAAGFAFPSNLRQTIDKAKRDAGTARASYEQLTTPAKRIDVAIALRALEFANVCIDSVNDITPKAAALSQASFASSFGSQIGFIQSTCASIVTAANNLGTTNQGFEALARPTAASAPIAGSATPETASTNFVSAYKAVEASLLFTQTQLGKLSIGYEQFLQATPSVSQATPVLTLSTTINNSIPANISDIATKFRNLLEGQPEGRAGKIAEAQTATSSITALAKTFRDSARELYNNHLSPPHSTEYKKFESLGSQFESEYIKLSSSCLSAVFLAAQQ